MKTTTNPATLTRTAKNTTDNAPDIVTVHTLFDNVVYCDPTTGKMRNRPTKSAQESAAALEKALTPADPRSMPDPTSDTIAADLYSMAHAAVAVCLRARDNASGQRLISDLRRMWGRDHKWSAAADMSAAADLYRMTHDQQREEAAAAQAESDKLTRHAAKLDTPTTSRAALLKAAAAHAAHAADLKRAAAENLRAAQDIEKQLEDLTASDRENLVHAAVVALLELQAPPADPDNQTDELFRAACTAAGRAIDALRAARAGSYKTKVKHMGDVEGEHGTITRKATAAENAATYDAWQQQHPGADKVPFAVRGGASAGYYTAEYRNTPRYPDGYYLVAHYVTEAPADLDTAADLTAAKAAALDVQRIAADLTPRQRTALYLLTIATGGAKPRKSADPVKNRKAAAAIAAIIRAGDAAAAALDEDTKTRQAAAKNDKSRQQMQRRADKRRAAVTRAAMLDKALTIAGVPASQLATQRAALRARLDRALTASPDPVTAAPAAVDVLAMWSSTAATLTPSRHPYPGHVASAGGLDVVWSDRYNPAAAHTLTEDEQRAEAAAEVERIRSHAASIAAAAFRRALRDHADIGSSRTAYPAHDAMRAAEVFTHDLTPAEWDEVGAAILQEQEQERSRREALRAAAKASGLYSLNMSLDQWRALTPEQRAAHVEWLNTL